jgi:hypothetical protein
MKVPGGLRDIVDSGAQKSCCDMEAGGVGDGMSKLLLYSPEALITKVGLIIKANKSYCIQPAY